MEEGQQSEVVADHAVQEMKVLMFVDVALELEDATAGKVATPEMFEWVSAMVVIVD